MRRSVINRGFYSNRKKSQLVKLLALTNILKTPVKSTSVEAPQLEKTPLLPTSQPSLLVRPKIYLKSSQEVKPHPSELILKTVYPELRKRFGVLQPC